MRFASGKDYYDSVLAFGRDDALFFERSQFSKARYITEKDAGLSKGAPRSLDFKGEHSWRRYSRLTIKGLDYSYTPYAVWFAGERFEGIRLEIRGNHWHVRPEEKPQWFWDKETFIAHLKSLHEDNSDEAWDLESIIDPASLTRLFDYTPSKVDIDWLVSNKISIAISSDHYYHGKDYYGSTEAGWYTNCDGLQAMSFAKALDTYSAFQKLSQWVGGVLSGDGKPMVKITNEKVILQKHGFDKRSFKHRV